VWAICSDSLISQFQFENLRRRWSVFCVYIGNCLLWALSDSNHWRNTNCSRPHPLWHPKDFEEPLAMETWRGKQWIKGVDSPLPVWCIVHKPLSKVLVLVPSKIEKKCFAEISVIWYVHVVVLSFHQLVVGLCFVVHSLHYYQAISSYRSYLPTKAFSYFITALNLVNSGWHCWY